MPNDKSDKFKRSSRRLILNELQLSAVREFLLRCKHHYSSILRRPESARRNVGFASSGGDCGRNRATQTSIKRSLDSLELSSSLAKPGH